LYEKHFKVSSGRAENRVMSTAGPSHVKGKGKEQVEMDEGKPEKA
jgi:hypothetical protein